MANIKVDRSQFEKAASAIEAYVSNHKKHMSTIDQSVNFLGSSWQGKDYDQLKIEWQQINSSGSTSDNMLAALANYADFLRYAANKYKTAQINAINRANRLPKY